MRSDETVDVDAVAAWRTHIGRTKSQCELVDVAVLRRFAVAAGMDPDVERLEPPLAHWAYFLEAAPRDRLGEDGHPLRGDFIPAIPLPRRMFAATSIQFNERLELGERAKCVTTITDVSHKNGRSGELVFVQLDRRISQKGSLRVHEQQTIVYRGAGRPVPTVPESMNADAPGLKWTPGPVDLFRFSAVTFNAHRIHYDRRYACEVEGYPGLVVQGPLTAVKLLGYAREVMGRTVRHYSARINAPLFVSQPVWLVGDEEGGSFTAVRCDGTKAVSARMEFE